MASIVHSTKHLKKKIELIFHKLFQNTKEEGSLPNTLDEATLSSYQTPPQKKNLKKTTDPYRSLMNIDAEILKKILQNESSDMKNYRL